jgi:hypothetical protein
MLENGVGNQSLDVVILSLLLDFACPQTEL